MSPAIADSITTGALVVPLDIVPDAHERQALITIRSLPGSTHYPAQFSYKLEKSLPAYDCEIYAENSSARFTRSTKIYSGIAAFDLACYPEKILLSSTVLEGPVELSYHVEGYTTDTITSVVEDHFEYFWDPVLVPAPGPDAGPAPTHLDPPVTILDTATQDALLGTCGQDPFLARRTDNNEDGLLDSADYAARR